MNRANAGLILGFIFGACVVYWADLSKDVGGLAIGLLVIFGCAIGGSTLGSLLE